MAKSPQPQTKTISLDNLDENLDALLNSNKTDLLDDQKKKRQAKRLKRVEDPESDQPLLVAEDGVEDGFDLALADDKKIELAQSESESDLYGAVVGGAELGAPVFGMPPLSSAGAGLAGVLGGGVGGYALAGLGVAAAGMAIASAGSSSGSSSTTQAINTISAAAEGNTATASTPDAATYQNAGVTGVGADNLAAINSALNSAVVNGAATDTAAEIQELVTAYNGLLAAADGIADGDPKATQADYAKIGVTGVDTAVEVSLLGEVIDAKNRGDVDSVTEVQTLADAVAAVMSGAAGATAPTFAQLTALGIAGVTADNLAAVQAAIAATPDNGAGVDTSHELQTVVNAAIVPTGVAINTISAAAEGNTATASTPDATTYQTAGVTGVDGTNLAAINSALNSAPVNGAATDTAAEVQALVNAYNGLLAAADGIADGDPKATPADYATIGVTGVDTVVEVSLLGEVIDAKNRGDVDSVTEVQTLADAVAAVMSGAAGATAPTQAQLTALGIAGITAGNLAAVQAAIAATPDNGTGVDTAHELQTVVNSAIDPVGIAINTISAAAEGNTATASAPDVTTYQTAGVTGVDGTTLAAINSALNTVVVNGAATDTTADIQAVVDAYKAILTEANGPAADSMLADPTAVQYAAIGATIGAAASDAENLSLLNDIVGAQSMSGVDTVAEIDNLARIANAVQAIAGGGTASPALSPADLVAIGITGVTIDNLPVVLARIAAQDDDGSGTDTLTELQALVGSGNAAIDIIKNYAESNSGTVPTLQNYVDAGVTGVTDAAMAASINSALATAGVTGAQADSTAHIQAVVDAYNKILGEANGSAVDATPGANPTVNQYAAIGASIGLVAFDVENLALLNDIVGAQSRDGVNTVAEIDELARIANAIQAIAAGGTVTPALTVGDLTAIGLTGVTLDNLPAVLAKIAAQDDGGAATDSLSDLQALINPIDGATTIIKNYAETNGGPVPTIQNYIDAGVSGVTDETTRASINSALATAGVTGAQADTAAHIQVVVDAYKAILAEANGSAPDPMLADPIAAQYAAIGANIGSAATDTENLALLDDIVGAQSRTGVDTVAKINELARIANAIELTAAGGSPVPALTVADLTAIGLTDVTPGNLVDILGRIAAQPDDGAATDSLSELQTLVSGTSGVITIIKNYAETNGGAVPTLQNYVDAGVSGVSDAAVAASINSALATPDITGAQADTVAHIQVIVDAYKAILAEANGPAADPTPADPTAAQYAAIGASIGLAATDTENLALLDDIVGAQSSTGVDTVAKINELARIANAIELTAAGGSPAPALTAADLAAIGISNVTAENLPAVLARIAAQDDSGAATDSLSEVQALVASLNTATDIIKNYAETNGGNVPTQQNYVDAGVIGVSDAAVAASINSALATAGVTGAQADTAAHIQVVVDAYKAILDEANGPATDPTPADPTAAQYAAIGASIGLAATDTENLALLDDIVGAQSSTGVDTVAKINELARIANAIELTAAGGTPALTAADLAAIGISNVTADNLPAVLAKIAAQPDDGTATDSLPELQGLVGTVTAAIDVIKNYAETNGGTVPTLQNYVDAGVSGVTDETTRASINSALATAGVTGAQADTAAHIQVVVDAYKAILDEANGPAADPALADPTAAQYAAIGASIGLAATDTENLSLLNDALGGKVIANVDTVAEINDLAVAANAVQALAAGTTGLTMDQLSLLGVTGNGGAALNTLSTINQQHILTAIANTNDNGTGTDTVAELQALVTAQLAPALRVGQSLDGVSNLGVDSALVIEFDQDISVKSGHVRIFDDMGTSGWTHTNAQTGQTLAETHDNDVDITLVNGAITAVTIGGLDYTSRFDLARSVQAVGHNLVIDLKQAVPTSVDNPDYFADVSPFSTAFDWDFGSNYHVELSANLVMNSALVGNQEVIDATTLNFTTVTPTDTVGGLASKVMDAQGISSALSDGYTWINGNQSQSGGEIVSLDLIGKAYAVVIDSSEGQSQAGSLGGNVSLQHFGFDNNTVLTKDDVLYNDNHGNTALATTDGVSFAAQDWMPGGGATAFAAGTFTRLISDLNSGGTTGSAYVNFNNTSTNSPAGANTLPQWDTYFEDLNHYNANVIIFG